MYPNGISMTMPEEAQLKFVRHMQGLENVEIVQPGEGSYVSPPAMCVC